MYQRFRKSAQTSPVLPARGQPFSRILLLGFLLVALLPVSLLGFKLYQVAWDDAWREVTEKHLLLAQNLAIPLSIYVNDHRTALGLLGDSIEIIAEQQVNNGRDWQPEQLQYVRQAISRLTGFRSVTLVQKNGSIAMSTNPNVPSRIKPDVFANEPSFLQTRKLNTPSLSGIKTSPLSGEPTLVLSQPVHARSGELGYILLGELRTDMIEQIRRKIRFGNKGYSVIVDSKGLVIAHPNPLWMREIKDLSHISIVQKMMAGETGITEFYSPFIQDNMVAGYAGVPDLGWGIMVPQPKSEIESHVNKLLYAQLGWATLGLFLALIISWALTLWITKPTSELCQASEDMLKKGLEGKLPELSNNAPREIKNLGMAFSEVVNGLQESRRHIDQLNQTLQTRVENATRELRETNISLEQMASLDYLTKMSNRRTFENDLMKTMRARREEDQYLCLMLIDIDNFKAINDQYGHAAGDEVLVQIAEILKSITRSTDLAARYAGDEFVVRMLCNQDVGRQRAKHLLEEIQLHRFMWDGHELQVTTSIGLLNGIADDAQDIDKILKKADEALYVAKDQGRNCIIEAGSRFRIA